MVDDDSRKVRNRGFELPFRRSDDQYWFASNGARLQDFFASNQPSVAVVRVEPLGKWLLLTAAEGCLLLAIISRAG
jgi:hypothetical protein